MRRLYNILYVFLLTVSAPYLLLRMWLRGGGRPGFRHRFGRYDAKFKQAITNRHVIWLHAGRVSDVNLCTQFIRAIENRLPNAKIIVSSRTVAGMEQLRRHLPSHIGRIYSPLDRRPWVARALATLNPEVIVFLEPDFWPNFLWRAKHRGTPVLLVDGRLSPGTRRRLSLFRSWFRPLLSSLTGVGVENEADRAAWVRLGCRSEVIRVVGNLNLDATDLEERRRVDVPALFSQLGWRSDALVLLGAGTHPGEERVLAEVFQRLRQEFALLYLVLAPAQIGRSREIGRSLVERGLRFVYRNEVMSHTRFDAAQIDCLLLNVSGELSHFYPHCTVIFLGATLDRSGGQSPIEPAAVGKPILFGMEMGRFAGAAARLVAQNGALQLRDATGLEQTLRELLRDPVRRAELGDNAKAAARESLGAVNRALQMIVEQVDEELYVAPVR